MLPTYEYRCTACNHQFERFQKMSDDPITECELCGAEVRRVLFPVAVHYKGSGFYTTDYGRKGSGRPHRAAAADSSDSETGGVSDGAAPAADKDSCCAARSDA